jgi:beta-glucosidase/6-phospho-beta-glucosidase/beta-galactosidase
MTEILATLEKCFYPTVEKCTLKEDGQIDHIKPTTFQKTIHLATNIFKSPFIILFGTVLTSFNVTKSIVTFPYRFFTCKKASKDAFLADSKELLTDDKINKLIAHYLPKYDPSSDSEDMGMGFATSAFQDCGLGTRLSKPAMAGTCNWDKWMPEHINMGKDEDKFINYLDHPQDLIAHLKNLNVSSYRISLERSVIEIEPGKFNLEAISKYKNLFKLLKENNIKPLVTFHHFVEPKWFADAGRFEKEENIEPFVEYCMTMIETFKDVVDTYMTFNELSMYILQTYIGKVYPIKGHEGIFHAGTVLKNLILAHVKIYRKTKEKYGDAIKVGVTHQWMQISPNNPKNPIERLSCYIFSKLTQKPVNDFFKRQKDGSFKFEYKIPGISNIEMTIPDKEKIGITDFLGVQNYGNPIVKVGFNGGEKFPGKFIMNFILPFLKFGFSAGGTCKKGGIASSFGPAFSPEALIDALIDTNDAGVPILISETGFDSIVQHFSKPEFENDHKVQKKAYEIIFTIIALARCKDNFSHKMYLRNHLITLIDPKTESDRIETIKKVDRLCIADIKILGCSFWTLFKNFEWENGWGHTGLHVMDVETDKKGRIISSKVTPAGKYVQEMLGLQRDLSRRDVEEISA